MRISEPGGTLIGIILLDTLFPRPAGDIGNPETFSYPVLYEKVGGALPSRVIRQDPSLLSPFVEAARRLERRGAKAITTSCGFLALYQRELAASVQIPVFTSSLIQIPWAHEMVGRKGQIGVLTADQEALSFEHLQGVGAETTPTVIRGMDPKGEFYRTYIGNLPRMDYERVEREVVETLEEMVKDHADLSALVLECTNMTLFRKAMREVFDRPIFDILTLIDYMHSVLK